MRVCQRGPLTLTGLVVTELLKQRSDLQVKTNQSFLRVSGAWDSVVILRGIKFSTVVGVYLCIRRGQRSRQQKNDVLGDVSETFFISRTTVQWLNACCDLWSGAGSAGVYFPVNKPYQYTSILKLFPNDKTLELPHFEIVSLGKSPINNYREKKKKIRRRRKKKRTDFFSKPKN